MIKTKWNPNNQEWLVSRGYKYEWRGKVEVYLLDLPITSKVDIEYFCDFCLEQNVKKYYKLLKGRECIEKDCCNKSECKVSKQREVMMKKHGVSHCMEMESTKSKIKNTMITRYGFEQPLQVQEFKDKAKNTTKEKYGKDYYMQTDEYKERAKQTNIERYGTEWAISSDYVRNITKESNMINYGVEFVSQREDVKSKVKATNLLKFGHISNLHNPVVREKMQIGWNIKYGGLPMRNSQVKYKLHKSKYENGTAPTSKQQNYIHSLIGGEINYPIGDYMLDIALIDEKIDIEYDGGGHNLSVKLGSINEEQFQTNETAREVYIESIGWKIIRIVTPTDELPEEKIIIEMVENARLQLNSKNKIIYNIINKTIQYDDQVFGYDFGDVKRLKQIKREVV